MLLGDRDEDMNMFDMLLGDGDEDMNMYDMLLGDRDGDMNMYDMLLGDGDEDQSEEKLPSCMDYVMHFLTIFWKILFAFVPPTGKITILNVFQN